MSVLSIRTRRRPQRLVHHRLASRRHPAPQCVAAATLTFDGHECEDLKREADRIGRNQGHVTLDDADALEALLPPLTLRRGAPHGHEAAAMALVEAGARLDLRSHTGQTPRELAQLYGYDVLARLLAEAERG